MTVKEMRAELFWIENQEMTIREFRALLFEEADDNKGIGQFIKEMNRK